MASLLDAAEHVFAEDGYAKATTNAIAARAGASPGTLYQFFPNKEAIAEALAARYVEQLRLTHDAAFPADVADLPLDELVNRVLDPILRFNIENPGFRALLADPGVPSNVATAKQPLADAVIGRIEALLAARHPDLPDQERARCARVCTVVFGALLPHVVAARGVERAALVTEAKRVLRGYLAGYEPSEGPASAETARPAP
jgi:AcrR family transcriptional regulator